MAILDVTTAYQANVNTPDTGNRNTRPPAANNDTRTEARDIFITRTETRTDAVESARRDESERRAAQSERRDAFIQSNVLIRNAVYNVSDVMTGGLGTLRGTISTGQYGSSGKRIDRKIIDILLPLGRKNLSIYSTEP